MSKYRRGRQIHELFVRGRPAFCLAIAFWLATPCTAAGSPHAQTSATSLAATLRSISPSASGSTPIAVSRPDGDAPPDPGPRARLSGSLGPEAVRAATRLVANWELNRARPYFGRSWTWSALYAGLMATSRALDDPRFRDAMLSMAEGSHWRLRSSQPDADDQSVAQTYLELYLQKPAPEEIEPTRTTLQALIAGGGPPSPPNQAQIQWWWCDSLFMAPPVWVRMYAATHERQYLDYLDKHFRQTSDLLYDTRRHLYFRDITFLHTTDQRGKPIFWSRGEGWVMAGLARTLEYLPRSDPEYGRYRMQLQQMAAAVTALQDPKDGLWHSDLLDPEDYPQPEVSGSALITFALAWGVTSGILDRATYMPAIAKAWRGLVGQIYADGRLGNIQPIGASAAHYPPSSSYNYGVGAFLLAGAEILDLRAHAGGHARTGLTTSNRGSPQWQDQQ